METQREIEWETGWETEREIEWETDQEMTRNCPESKIEKCRSDRIKIDGNPFGVLRGRGEENGDEISGENEGETGEENGA